MNIGVGGYWWVAYVFFATPQDCDSFNERMRLQDVYEPQCVIVQLSPLATAPEVSPRPKPRPERKQ